MESSGANNNVSQGSRLPPRGVQKRGRPTGPSPFRFRFAISDGRRGWSDSEIPNKNQECAPPCFMPPTRGPHRRFKLPMNLPSGCPAMRGRKPGNFQRLGFFQPSGRSIASAGEDARTPGSWLVSRSARNNKLLMNGKGRARSPQRAACADRRADLRLAAASARRSSERRRERQPCGLLPDQIPNPGLTPAANSLASPP